MLIKIITIGNKFSQWVHMGIEFFLKQLPKSLNIDFVELRSQQNPRYSLNEVLQKESSLIFSKILKDDFVISWDVHGNDMNSKDFSSFILDCQRLKQKIVFIVG